MLKPALARGQLRCVGATTIDEYRKYVERDAALARRFQPVPVGEPSISATLAILRGLRERYELHHGVRIADAALVAAAENTARYVSDRFLPDKAIDVVDEAAARLRVQHESTPEPVERARRAITLKRIERTAIAKDLAAGGDGTGSETRARLEQHLRDLDEDLAHLEEVLAKLTARWERERTRLTRIQLKQTELDRARRELEQSQRDGRLERAGELLYSVIPRLTAEIREATAAAAEAGARGSLVGDYVTARDINEVIARSTGIPVADLERGERQRLLELADRLGERVRGQGPAVRRVADAVCASRAGLAPPDRPVATFLFLGPTGVGKTALAQALADELFGHSSASPSVGDEDDEGDGALPSAGPSAEASLANDRLIRIDMSEFSEPHSISRLIGSPPGYIGHDEGGMLTERVRRAPYSVVLLDEIEKAAPEARHVLLPLLDAGRLTDGRGRTVDFRNTVVVMTSNIGAGAVVGPGVTGGAAGPGAETPEERRHREQATREVALRQLRSRFSPEFINRIDGVVVFRALTPVELDAILQDRVEALNQRLARRWPGGVSQPAPGGDAPAAGAAGGGLVPIAGDGDASSASHHHHHHHRSEGDIRLVIAPDARERIVQAAAAVNQGAYGARPLLRMVDRLLNRPLARLVLSGAVRHGTVDIALVEGTDDWVRWTQTPPGGAGPERELCRVRIRSDEDDSFDDEEDTDVVLGDQQQYHMPDSSEWHTGGQGDGGDGEGGSRPAGRPPTASGF
ncbi:hypothetical protein, variant [Fonticula alba]|nr:hypothetical protein, variant [Fonticula alba]KCV67855.1 hypothetical protein, variant [Fonticula alba]|eukprot:XP_009497675.1 hypothetical protein, variant [Fonticula alba]